MKIDRNFISPKHLWCTFGNRRKIASHIMCGMAYWSKKKTQIPWKIYEMWPLLNIIQTSHTKLRNDSNRHDKNISLYLRFFHVTEFCDCKNAEKWDFYTQERENCRKWRTWIFFCSRSFFLCGRRQVFS